MDGVSGVATCVSVGRKEERERHGRGNGETHEGDGTAPGAALALNDAQARSRRCLQLRVNAREEGVTLVPELVLGDPGAGAHDLREPREARQHGPVFGAHGRAQLGLLTIGELAVVELLKRVVGPRAGHRGSQIGFATSGSAGWTAPR